MAAAERTCTGASNSLWGTIRVKGVPNNSNAPARTRPPGREWTSSGHNPYKVVSERRSASPAVGAA
eukprot:6085442-Pyramimonas_sp.AAC.1